MHGFHTTIFMAGFTCFDILYTLALRSDNVLIYVRSKVQILIRIAYFVHVQL